MKRRLLMASAAAAAVAAGLFALTTGSEAAPPGSKVVQLDCAPGWRAGAGGSYGGVPFSVTCKYGKGSFRLDNPQGGVYTIRMGVETDSVAADCGWSGDSIFVAKTCADVRITIQ